MAPHVFEIQWNLANALYIAGRGKESADAYRAALAIQPASAEAHYRLGKALYLAGDAPGALAEVDAAMRMGYRTPEVLATRGIALAATGDRAGAERDLRDAVAGDPKIVEAWNKLGILAAQGGRNEEARDLFGRALAADADNADALYNHAQASMMLKDRATAERDVARLLEKHPAYPKTWYLKAHLLIASGDREGAKAVVRSFLARPGGTDPQQVASAQEMLKKLGG
jgi:Flp pilus assembly protein TadD